MQAQVQTQTQAQTQAQNIKIEVVKILKRWNISESAVADKIKEYMFANERVSKEYVTLYRHDEWGSCREWKSVVMNIDGSYIPDGEWIDKSSSKNEHKYKVMLLSEFIEKYVNRELVIYVYESPSCNKSKQFSFKAIFKVVVE
jgi:hypothetical protein